MFSLLVPPTGNKEGLHIFLKVSEYLSAWFTIWLALSSASSKTIKTSALCKIVQFDFYIKKHLSKERAWQNVCMFQITDSCLCLPYFWSVRYVLFLLHKPWPQGGRKALWERVTILACHNQVKGCAELRESESSISIHITQLPLKK